LLILGVFVVLTVASEAGFFAGRWVTCRFRKQKQVAEDVDNNVITITNSSLALLALFLGFTFSSALDHFEKNREAVTNEASTITEAYQLINLQREPFRGNLVKELREYIDGRLKVAGLPNDPQALRALQQENRRQQNQIWSTVREMSEQSPEAPCLQLLVESLNNMVTAEKNRTESLINGVPNGLFLPVAFFLLFNGVLVGISLGEGAKRHILLSWGMYFLVALSVGIIVDLDRPLKGFINVDQQAMTLLKQNL
jgi:hypothetical protein